MQRIYELKEKPILTPKNLLDNIKLENYKGINYGKNETGITCTLIEQEHASIVKHFYQFDSRDFLIKINSFYDEENIVLFDRKLELDRLLQLYDINDENSNKNVL